MMYRRTLCVALLLLLGNGHVFARDAAFVEPGTFSSKGAGADALIADPKSFDAAESTVGVLRHVSLFFVNTGGAPVTIAELIATGDGNVKVEKESSDCQPASKIPGYSRCTVALGITPTSAGAWTVEILIKHDGMGRIARALVSGRAVNDAKNAARGEGLNLSSRDMKPIDFGDVDAGGAPAVRTALMVNDSPETIIIKSIDLIAVDEGLERITSGCQVDQELKTDESCPITIKWQPRTGGAIATDLIMRHTGKIGFTVLPIRGRGVGTAGGLSGLGGGMGNKMDVVAGKPPAPLSAVDVASVTGQLPASVTTEMPAATPTLERAPPRAAPKGARVHLIGAVGRRAILQSQGETKTVAIGDEIDLAGASVKLLSLVGREARVLVDGAQRALQLGNSGYRPPPVPGKNEAGSGQKIEALSSNSQSSSGK